MNNNFQNMYSRRPTNPGDDRFFVFPFLTGALVGGAAVGLTRPRPIYNVAPYPGNNLGYNPGYNPGLYQGYAPRPYSYYSGGYGY